MAHSIPYRSLLRKALQHVVAQALAQVEKDGLHGDHHFFITFDTTHDGVEMAQSLMDRYPEEMTIVMQDWFENLTVEANRFIVTLNFGDVPEPIAVPFDALKSFVDPSVEFGLRFDMPWDLPEDAAEDAEPADAEEEAHDAEVVSLDNFRKP